MNKRDRRLAEDNGNLMIRVEAWQKGQRLFSFDHHTPTQEALEMEDAEQEKELTHFDRAALQYMADRLDKLEHSQGDLLKRVGELENHVDKRIKTLNYSLENYSLDMIEMSLRCQEDWFTARINALIKHLNDLEAKGK